jgi:hypothetical protein
LLANGALATACERSTGYSAIDVAKQVLSHCRSQGLFVVVAMHVSQQLRLTSADCSSNHICINLDTLLSASALAVRDELCRSSHS